MTDIIDFNSLPIKAQANLIVLSKNVAGVVPIKTKEWRFATNTLQPGTEMPIIVSKVVNDVAEWVGKDKDNVFLYTLWGEMFPMFGRKGAK